METKTVDQSSKFQTAEFEIRGLPVGYSTAQFKEKNELKQKMEAGKSSSSKKKETKTHDDFL